MHYHFDGTEMTQEEFWHLLDTEKGRSEYWSMFLQAVKKALPKGEVLGMRQLSDLETYFNVHLYRLGNAELEHSPESALKFVGVLQED